VRRVERLSILGKVGFVSLEHTVEPREELLGAVVRVENDRNAVEGSQGAHMKSQGNGSSGCSVGVLDALSTQEGTASVGHLNHDGGLVDFGSFHDGVGGRGTVFSERFKSLCMNDEEDRDRMKEGIAKKEARGNKKKERGRGVES
jgi:hypothetical protein